MKLLKVSLLYVLFLISCTDEKGVVESDSVLFDLLDNKTTGIEFENNLGYSKEFNVYKYRNFYNGGGVAIGDVNNDGLADIYMTANQTSNKLYINKGDWVFEDITEMTGVGGTKAWSTGTTMVDVNADGLLDIYVCNSGDVAGDNKENELFINNGDNTFTESAALYGLNDKGFSTHASFFDYDKDGDLDAYILNNSFQAIGSFNLRKNERPVRDELGGDKLLQNKNGLFVDVSEEAGIYGSVIGFGLGVTVGDVNNDNWEDIFVSNDFFERDYLYINQKNGKFSEELVDQMSSISGASMGADIGDIDNDGYNDIFVTEMLPSDYERLKSVTTFESWDRYQYSVKNGYHHQFTRNTLHRNNTNGTFSEVSRHAGVEASDWSWGALFFDMDDDGLKDLFVANGIYKDLTDQDYLQYIANESVLKSVINDDGVNYKELIDIIPSNPVPNHAFKNKGHLKLEPYDASGLTTNSFSNGAAYGDLDNDGDLDLVVNNVNMPCFVYKNNASSRANHNSLSIKLEGIDKNPFAIGSRVIARSGNEIWTSENQPARGFQSSMDSRTHIGIAENSSADIEVIWPDGKSSFIKSVPSNKPIIIKEGEAEKVTPNKMSNTKHLTQVAPNLDYKHKENQYVDFNKERLLYHMMSSRGPCVSVADLDGDSKIDLVIPGSKGSVTKVLLSSQGFKNKGNIPNDFAFKTKEAEHIECEIFDADNDGDLDIYVASGGVELTKFSELLYDRLLFNNGEGFFASSSQKLPSTDAKISSSVVTHEDVDSDGDIDLFVGERVKIGRYGEACSGYILTNDGKGQYTDVTKSICPELIDMGMVTDAKWVDLDGDKINELIVVGEFMDVSIFQKKGKVYKKQNLSENLSGWWLSIATADIDGDGDQDIILGNHGTNSRFKAGEDTPIKLYFNDYDNNGTPEGIMTHTREDGKDYPYALRHTLQGQMSMLKKTFPSYESYKSASINDIFSQEKIESATVLEAVEMKSLILINNGDVTFTKQYLPSTVQLSPMFAIMPTDIDDDGDVDIFMGGNLYNVQPEVGRYDASHGHLLINDGKGNYEDKSVEYGFSVSGEIRDIEEIGGTIHVFRNNDNIVAYKYQNKSVSNNE